MNCQPGDLAIVIRECRYKGRLLEVLYERPPFGTLYTLPNGHPAEVTTEGPGWVVRLFEPMRVVWTRGETRMTTYGDCRDSDLKPLRGLPEDMALSETEANTCPT